MADITDEQIRAVLGDVLQEHANKAALNSEEINQVLNQTVQALGMNKMVLPDQSEAVANTVGIDKVRQKDINALVEAAKRILNPPA